MSALAEAQMSGVWLERSTIEEAENRYQEYLVRGSAVKGDSKPVKGADSKSVSKVETTAGRVAQQIAEARRQIQETLKDSYALSSNTTSSADSLRDEVEKLKIQQTETVKLVTQLNSRFETLEARLSAIEGKPATSQTPAAEPAAASEEEDDDSDVDLFGSDDDDEEAERIKAERIAAYNERKSKKVAVIAKSSILLDIKPWDDETDMVEVERLVRSVECDGLTWGASKLIKVAYGILKLQISCVVEDDKVGTDFLEEEITKFEDHIQSVDIAAFNKI